MPTQSISPSQVISLATYREIQAHLQQLSGVNVTLRPAQHQQFDYADSQVVGLEITYPESSLETVQHMQSILQHYGIVS